MFEAVELDRKVSKDAFKQQEPQLRTKLLELQEKLREASFPVIVIVSGVEGAGKSEVVNRLNEWLDTRDLENVAFWNESDEERERPRFWRFWRKLPARGRIGIMFGSWYTQPIIENVFGRLSDSQFDVELRHINELERMLTDDGALIVKFWYHLDQETQTQRIEDKRQKMADLVSKFSSQYEAFAKTSARAIRMTDSGHSPWYLVEAKDKRYRDLTTATTLISALEQRLAAVADRRKSNAVHEPILPEDDAARVTILDHIDIEQSLKQSDYKQALKDYQTQLYELAWEAHNRGISCINVFEGWDAAGKGGVIRRITGATDARLYQVISVAAPSDEELAHHYLWRFWRHIPRAGYITIYDRSWYGRVLVERVEGFARQNEWARAYREVNDFEERLSEHGIVINKFWLHISLEEQLRRFKEREKIPWKKYKITEEDWRNRDRWDEYKHAVNDMVAKTSTAYAPWHLVPANDKRFARIEVLKTVCEQLERRLADD